MSTPAAPIPWQQLAVPLIGLGVLGTRFAAMTCCWTAATAAAEAVPSFGGPTLRAMVSAAGTGTVDPLIGVEGSRPVFWSVLAVGLALLLGLIVGGGVWIGSRAGRRGEPRSAMAGHRDTRDMRGRAAQKRAVQLRPSLAGHDRIDNRDLGLCLGRRLGGVGESRLLYASEEDVMLQIAGPRSNKTSAQVVPAILSAPGPVIATSNKVDVYTLTIGLRAELGRTFVADPQGIAGVEQSWWWNPLADIKDLADAGYLVAHFSRTVGAGNSNDANPFFTRGAERLLTQLVLAASCSPDKSLRDVRTWLATQANEPVELLENSGFEEIAEGLRGLQDAPAETRGGLFETALTALGSLESEAVARLVTPPSTWRDPPRVPVEEFDPWRFLVGYRTDSSGNPVPRDTVYLLTREGAGSGAPVVAALVDHLLRIAAQAATAQGGRLDPPLRPVLDEAANVCPIANLPDLYSYFGSMSIQVLSFLQSYQQGVAVWGKSGMDKMWSAATIKLVGAGVQDPEFARWISDLIGPLEVPTYSHQYGRGGGSTSTSMREKPVMTVADVGSLDKRHAILLSAGRRPVLLELMPWYREGDAETISAHAAEATAQVRQSAVSALGPRNPLAQRLAARERDPRGGAT
ncbi:Type IV secretory pathway, VirD4 component, TraG/TraD family ATPase [Pseudonocardia ammonioxydans]|uniref:Type IV secretory pathway, VirD4 component, TraG/TraD family ATPase n=1 Tax=Pseudonocardia ammonioxydans TaxID=260086 RepID=A0A1I5GJQ7_PSUAM|nr:type IV secretory system conjugative DNA transfer family protein [Pseudonocardia ammonioxydans]SFO36225.1 Type IV secretory pathway, VirD4 component, TraG/TraD family ATPase [Pseudonocardia ammonioxydans]